MDKRSKERISTLDIYTDGSCKKLGSTTFGGWGFIAVRDSEKIYFSEGNERGTTNQRMELTAIANGLKYAQSARKPSEKVIIYSDSAYAINCYLKEWYIKWQFNGFINSNNEPVANKDLWLQIIPYFDNFWYDFRKVEGHKGNYWNEVCDELAQKSAEHLKLNWRG